MRIARALCILTLIGAAPAAAELVGPEVLDRLPPADVVILGEVHDNPLHHRNQARAVAALQPRALVFEMLTPAQAAAMPADRTDAAALRAALGWDAAGWPDFALYHPIFTAAPEAAVFGGNVPRDDLRRALVEGAGAVFGADAARYGLDIALLPADQAAREADQSQAHCNALPPEMLPGMVAGQRLRDAALARAVVQAMAATGGAMGGPVVVITGTGHARRDQGIPVPLALAAPGLRVLSLGQLEDDPGSDAPFDLWIVTPPAEREDPCATFAPKKS